MSCSIETCERPAVCRGWCNPHYQRWYRYGDPTGAISIVGAGNPQWTGDAATFDAVHQRLEAAFGKASDGPCADCGAQALDWSFDEPTGYSTDLSRYQRRCRSCHKKFDSPKAVAA